MEKELIEGIFNKPKIISICSDVNEGKSNLIYHLIEDLKKKYRFNLYSYGLIKDLGENKIYTLEELENIKDSIIFIDEFENLFDIEDRKKRKSIEKSLRLINHNNNIVILSGLPENFKKFISSKIDVMFFSKCTIADFINGSTIKNRCLSYQGWESGSTLLNIEINKCLIYNGSGWNKIDVPYMSDYDTKKGNKPLLEKVSQSVPKKDKKPFKKTCKGEK
jgi:hypothetical protein